MAAATAASWSITDLGAGFVPRDINDHGVILPSWLTIDGSEYYGIALNNVGQMLIGRDRPYLLNNGVLVDLTKPGLNGVQMRAAFALNDAGQVAGSACISNNGVGCGMAVWQNGQTRLVSTNSRFEYSRPEGINSHGDLAGDFYTPSVDLNNAVLVTGSNVVPMGLKGAQSSARALNDLGWVVGQADTQWNFSVHAFFYDGKDTIDLGTLGGFNSSATSINNAGQVVGSSETSFFFESSQHAFLWQNGSMLDLSKLPEVQAAGWDRLESAYRINERGQIVGTGYRDGVSHGFLLTPVPEPETWALLLLGLAMVGMRKRSQSPLAT